MININADIGIILDKIIDRKDIYNILEKIYECRKVTYGGFELILFNNCFHKSLFSSLRQNTDVNSLINISLKSWLAVIFFLVDMFPPYATFHMTD